MKVKLAKRIPHTWMEYFQKACRQAEVLVISGDPKRTAYQDRWAEGPCKWRVCAARGLRGLNAGDGRNVDPEGG